MSLYGSDIDALTQDLHGSDLFWHVPQMLNPTGIWGVVGHVDALSSESCFFGLSCAVFAV